MVSSAYIRNPRVNARLNSTIAVINGGTNYTTGDAVTIEPPTNVGTPGIPAVGTIIAAGGIVTGIAFTEQGLGYGSPPKITAATGDGNAILGASLEKQFLDNTNMFTEDISIIPEDLRVGGAGILRLFMSFSGAVDPNAVEVQVFNNGILKGFLNADIGMQLVSNGFYHFDIDLQGNDNINLRQVGGTPLTAVNLLRAHLVPFGA